MEARVPLIAFSLAALLVLAGCLGGKAPTVPSVAPQSVATPDVRPALVAPKFLSSIDLGNAFIGAEPNVAVGKDGTVYVTTPLHLWRSTDAGESFKALGEPYCQIDELSPAPMPACPPGEDAKNPGLDGGGDGDVAVDANGTVYWLGLGGAKGSIPFQASTDQGEHFGTVFDVAEKHSTDREWIDVRADGEIYTSWRDFGKAQNDPSHLVFRHSPNGGKTWDPVRVVTDDHLAGPVVHDPSSRAVYVPYWDGGIKLATSGDDGATWKQLTVLDSMGITEDPVIGAETSTIFPVAAVDSAGTIYVVWSQPPPGTTVDLQKYVSTNEVFLASSTDHGATFSKPIAISPPGHAAVLPWIVAGKPGRVAVVWYENENGLPSETAPDLWDVSLLESVNADAAKPEFKGGHVNAAPVHVGSICSDGGLCLAHGGDRSFLDFFEVALTPAGQPVVVYDSDSTIRAFSAEVNFGGVSEGTPLV